MKGGEGERRRKEQRRREEGNATHIAHRDHVGHGAGDGLNLRHEQVPQLRVLDLVGLALQSRVADVSNVKRQRIVALAARNLRGERRLHDGCASIKVPHVCKGNEVHDLLSSSARARHEGGLGAVLVEKRVAHNVVVARARQQARGIHAVRHVPDAPVLYAVVGAESLRVDAGLRAQAHYWVRGIGLAWRGGRQVDGRASGPRKEHPRHVLRERQVQVAGRGGVPGACRGASGRRRQRKRAQQH